MRQAGEPSVEEILSSIKKVIARDSRAEVGRSETRRPNSDVLDLADVAAQVLGAAPDRKFGDDQPQPESAEPAENGDDAGLLSRDTTSAMRESLAALAMLAEPGARPQIVRSGETSLEGLVRDMLRPMLAEWLDRNLPAMVDRMVAAEITRIVHKKS